MDGSAFDLGLVDAIGLAWLVAAASVAGVVRGFSGFGTAMIYLPIAGQILPPFAALTTLVLMDLLGPLPLVPRAIRDGHPSDVARLAGGLCLAMPVGVFLLTQVPAEVFRYSVSIMTLGLLALLMSGLRYRGHLSPPLVVGTGALGGLSGGAVGLPGPPVILLYMASALPPAAIRANTTLYLILADFVLIFVLYAYGQLIWQAVFVGALLILPYAAGGLIGQRLFRPDRATLYRRVAYAIIGASALFGLPLWD